jgi:prepilin-type N-terminal cleavage/methylation domain-containing protein
MATTRSIELCSSAHRRRERRSRTRGAFTLLELLIVIAIITLLAAISLAIGAKVLSGGRESLTTNVVRAMDNGLNSYITDGGDRVPDPIVEHPESTSASVLWQPIADARRGESYDDEMVNSVGWFIYQMKDVSSVSSTISGLSSKIVKQYSPNVDADGIPPEAEGQPLMTTAFDGWGRPLRYVHPTFDGVLSTETSITSTADAGLDVADLVTIGPSESFTFVKIRRNRVTKAESDGTVKVADSDGGLCPNNRPYFYSAGADGDPSTTEDNVYIAEPQVQSE